MRNYEAGAVAAPEPRPLYAYMNIATSFWEPELAAVFRCAFNEALGIDDRWNGQLSTDPWGSIDRLLVAAVLASYRQDPPDSGFEKFQKPVLASLEEPCRLLIKQLHLKRDQDAWADFLAELKNEDPSWLREQKR